MNVKGYRKLGKELNISHEAARKAHLEGRIKANPDGTFDVDKCKAAMQKNTHPIQSAKGRSQRSRLHFVELNQTPHKHREGESVQIPSNETDAGSVAEAVRQREWLKVRELECDLAERAGVLAPVAELHAMYEDLVAKAKDLLLAMGPELSDTVAEESDPKRCEAIITREAHRVLNELRKGLQVEAAA